MAGMIDLARFELSDLALNTRETAIAVWLTILAAWLARAPTVRQGLHPLWRAVTAPKMIVMLALMLAWIIASVALLAWLELWDWHVFNATVVWTVTFGFVSLMNIGKFETEPGHLRNVLRGIVPVTILIAFVAGWRTMPLPFELIFVPTAALLGAILGLAQAKEEHRIIIGPLQWLIGAVGLTAIVFGLHSVYTEPQKFFMWETGQKFWTPILLSFLFVPFLILFGTWATYEGVYTRLQWAIPDEDARWYAKLRAPFAFGFRVQLLRRWREDLHGEKPRDREAVDRIVRETKERARLEANPPYVPPGDGWSPYIVKSLLEDDDLVVGDYRRSFNGWHASSGPRSLDKGFRAATVTFSVEGTERAAHRLQLSLHGRGDDGAAAAEERFREFVRFLVMFTVTRETDNVVVDLFRQDPSFTTLNGYRITSVIERFAEAFEGEYERTVTIEHPASGHAALPASVVACPCARVDEPTN